MPFMPKLQLLIKTNKANQHKIINDLIEFLNIKNTPDLLEQFNFIRFINKEITLLSSNNTELVTPSFSCILFSTTNNHCINNEWKYHHKIELNDERGKVVASQHFYQLNNDLPLFCKSIWIPSSTSSNKHIIRININCIKYDLMLIFYRLLFDKYPNYIKNNFTVFILHNNNNDLNSNKYEFQLSLKYDINVLPSLNAQSLVYCIDSRTQFEYTIKLLNDLLKCLVPNHIYSIYDPDGNQIYLVDSSKSNPYWLKQYSTILQSTGLYEYLLTTSLNPLSASISTSSNYSSSSFNSNKTSPLQSPITESNSDSGRWSNLSPTINNNNNNNNNNNDNYNYCCYQKISAVKKRSPRRLALSDIKSNSFHQQQQQQPNMLKKKSKSVTFYDIINKSVDSFDGYLETMPKLSQEKRRSKSCLPFDDYQDNDYDLILRSYNPKSSYHSRKPNVGITRETRLRKSHTLNMIKSTKMPTVNINHHYNDDFYQQEHIILKDKYNNKLILPVAKF